MATPLMRRELWLSTIGAVVLCVGFYGGHEHPPTNSSFRTADSSCPAPTDDEHETVAIVAKPAAMADPSTYAAARLREIKSDPSRWNDVWSWRREFTLADMPELQREVVGLARQIGPDSFLAILAQALASADPLVRIDAARAIGTLPDNRMAEGIRIGVVASDPETRHEVMDIIEQVQPHLRAELLGASLLAGPVDVQLRAVETLTDRPNPAYFAVLIDGLRTASGETRQSIEKAIADVVGESLTGYEEANRWWMENHDRFDWMMARVQ
jgi:hypothetical protein